MEPRPILVDGAWRRSEATSTFHAVNPRTAEPLADTYPVSPWSEVSQVLHAATNAFTELRKLPYERLGSFLEAYASRIEARRDELVTMAHAETGLPVQPRLRDVELPRTTDQLRQAAKAAQDRGWALPTIDQARNIRSMHVPIGPVVVFGPNNFPFAFNSVAGGDFAAAIAAGCPVIAKGHPSHPGTTRILAEEAKAAAEETGMPSGMVQLLYHLNVEDGLRLVADPRVGATAFTGSRTGGLALKAAADDAGKPIHLELGSVNPVVILPGALRERAAQIAEELSTSCLMGSGQFCTKPGLVFLIAGPETEQLVAGVAERLRAAPIASLLNEGVRANLAKGVAALRGAGAELLAGGAATTERGFSFQNTLLRVAGSTFLQESEALQTEAFGNAGLIVVVKSVEELQAALAKLHGNLTASVYSDTRGADDEAYEAIEPLLRLRVGRLLNDKMPTGVAVSPAMVHGGPFPASGHPGFTAVGIPASLRRFTMLACYDNVRPHRLPPELR